jgi:hypothetical protein
VGRDLVRSALHAACAIDRLRRREAASSVRSAAYCGRVRARSSISDGRPLARSRQSNGLKLWPNQSVLFRHPTNARSIEWQHLPKVLINRRYQIGRGVALRLRTQAPSPKAASSPSEVFLGNRPPRYFGCARSPGPQTSEMQSKIACDHDDHDHYADNVKDIHCFAPIETTGVERHWMRRSPSRCSAECALGIPAVCIELTSSVLEMVLERTWFRGALIRTGSALPARSKAAYAFNDVSNLVRFLLCAFGMPIGRNDSDPHLRPVRHNDVQQSDEWLRRSSHYTRSGPIH